VRRRPRSRDAGVPEQLCRFVAAEWPGRCRHERHWAYTQACLAWLREGPGRRLPFGEYGDVIDVLRESEAVCRRELPCPDEFRPGTYRGPGAP
jgi:hypothetical protein